MRARDTSPRKRACQVSSALVTLGAAEAVLGVAFWGISRSRSGMERSHFLKNNTLRLRLIVLAFLSSLGGCGYPYREAVPMSLKELAGGHLWVILDSSVKSASLRIYPEEGFSDCPVLTGNVVATVNGVRSNLHSNGQASKQDEGYYLCEQPLFLFDSLNGSTGSPDGEFVLDDGAYSMRLTIRNVLEERKLTRLTPTATLKPGGSMVFEWQPISDSLLSGRCQVNGAGNTSHRFPARIESGLLVADLPTDPWPAGANLQVSVNAMAPIVKCEGVRECKQNEMLLSDVILLPSP